MSSPLANSSYQKSVYQDFSEERSRLSQQAKILHRFEMEILKRHGLENHHDVLDLGCGQGFLTYAVANFLHNGTIDGVDIDQNFISEAKRNFINYNLNYVQGSAYNFFPEKKYDFIFSRLLFQHLKDPQIVIGNLKNYLKPNGKICIIDVNDEWLFIEPQLSEFTLLVNESIQFQSACGGDRLVAKKLANLYSHENFKNIKIEIIPFSSELVGMEKFLEIAISFRANYAYKNISGKELYETIRAKILTNSESFFGLMGVFCISASYE